MNEYVTANVPDEYELLESNTRFVYSFSKDHYELRIRRVTAKGNTGKEYLLDAKRFCVKDGYHNPFELDHDCFESLIGLV